MTFVEKIYSDLLDLILSYTCMHLYIEKIKLKYLVNIYIMFVSR